MVWKNGRSVAVENRVEGDQRRSFVSDSRSGRIKLPLILLRANKIGRRRMQDGLFDSATLQAKIEAGAFTNAVLSAVVAAGAFAANAATRALFGAGFVNSDLLEAGAVTKTKLAGGFLKQSVLTGSTAGMFQLIGINPGDSLVYVHEQNGTSGIITDRTPEFTIKSKDYISNSGGTNTTGDKLLVLYLDLT